MVVGLVAVCDIIGLEYWVLVIVVVNGCGVSSQFWHWWLGSLVCRRDGWSLVQL